MFASLAQYLPVSEGWLANWQLFVATTALFNFGQNFLTLKLSRKVYNGVPPNTVTGLQARTFAIWTLTAALVRVYAAYNINNKPIYDMAFFTYLFAFFHFTTELLFYRTCKLLPGAINPVIVSTVSLVWMFNQYEFYIRK